MISGDLGNITSYNENSCGALSYKVTLDPGESRTVLFLLGMKSSAEAAAITDSYTDPAGQVTTGDQCAEGRLVCKTGPP